MNIPGITHTLLINYSNIDNIKPPQRHYTKVTETSPVDGWDDHPGFPLCACSCLSIQLPLPHTNQPRQVASSGYYYVIIIIVIIVIIAVIVISEILNCFTFTLAVATALSLYALLRLMTIVGTAVYSIVGLF
jgi:hypothetical protein